MNDERFDALTRTLAAGVSRRQVLKYLGGSLTGGLLAFLGVREAAADAPGCKRNGKTCRRDDQCCSGACIDGTCQTFVCRELFEPCEYDSDCCAAICDVYTQDPSREKTCRYPCDPTLGNAGCGIQGGDNDGSYCCDFGDGRTGCAQECPASP